MNGDELGLTIRTFVVEELLGGDAPADLTDETPLLSSGLVDSIGLEQLLFFFEDELGLTIEDADLKAAHFETISSIRRLLERKLESSPGGSP